MKYILVKEGKEGPGLLIYMSIFIFLWWFKTDIKV
jgi:hypothetical protein